jgi:hypothetical protein
MFIAWRKYLFKNAKRKEGDDAFNYLSSLFAGGTGYRTWLRHYATSRKIAGSIPNELIGFFFNLRNPCSRAMALGSTQPLTEMSTRNRSGDKGRPVRKADNLTAICELIV